MEWLDISATKVITDVNLLKSKVDGVILKLGYTGWGSLKPAKSTGFEEQYKLLHDAGVPIGIYYFTLATSEAMVDMETKWVLEQIADKEINLPIWVDCEAQPNAKAWTALDKTTRSTMMSRWCKNIENAGYYAGIYAGVNTWKHNTILVTSMLTAYDKWVAQYYTKCQYDGVAGVDYGAWQYSSSGVGADYGCKSGQLLDVSHVYKDYVNIIKKAGLNHLKKEETAARTKDDVIAEIETLLTELKGM